MSPQQFSDPFQPGQLGGGKYLPGKNSVKDDLQAIFALNQEIGSAMFHLIKALDSLRSSMDTKQSGLSGDSHSTYERLKELTDAIQDLESQHKQLLLRVGELLDSDVVTDVGEIKSVILPHVANFVEIKQQLEAFTLAAKLIFRTNGYDDRGQPLPTPVAIIHNWGKHLRDALWSAVVSVLLTLAFYSLLRSAMAEDLKNREQFKMYVEESKKQLNLHQQQNIPQNEEKKSKKNMD
jgi:hypothetical protein